MGFSPTGKRASLEPANALEVQCHDDGWNEHRDKDEYQSGVWSEEFQRSHREAAWKRYVHSVNGAYHRCRDCESEEYCQDRKNGVCPVAARNKVSVLVYLHHLLHLFDRRGDLPDFMSEIAEVD